MLRQNPYYEFDHYKQDGDLYVEERAYVEAVDRYIKALELHSEDQRVLSKIQSCLAEIPFSVEMLSYLESARINSLSGIINLYKNKNTDIDDISKSMKSLTISSSSKVLPKCSMFG